MDAEIAERSGERLSVLFDTLGEGGLGRAVVGNSEAATGVDVADVESVGDEIANEAGDALHGVGKRGNIGDLRADVDADADRLDVFMLGGEGIEFAGAIDGYAELVFAE